MSGLGGTLAEVLDQLEERFRVAAGDRPAVAAFDADGVLWRGDVSEDFTRWMIGKGHFDPGLWEPYVRINDADKAAGCLEILRFYTGLHHADLAARVAEFWQHRDPDWIGPAVAAVRRLAAAGFPVFVVSGTPRPVLEPLSGYLPVPGERVLGLELEFDGAGRATGRHRGEPTCGPGKAAALRARTALPVCLAAGNSVLDVELLRLSEHLRWVIEPDPELHATATREGWWITDERGHSHD